MSGAAAPRESSALTAYVAGVGLLGPGLTDWRSGAPILAGGAPYQPSPTVLPVAQALPAAERRRVGAIVKLAIGVAQQAVAEAALDPAQLPAVFASSGGDGVICHEICATLATEERQISPTRFHNSVHNAASGYWSIATGATAASSAVAAYDSSFAAGLIEVLAQIVVNRTPALLCAYETPYPEPLLAKRPMPDSFGTALVLTPTAGASCVARITAALGEAPADRLADPALERLRGSVPAARSLPLLRLLARREAGRVALEYLPEQRLVVEVSQCR